MKVYLSFFLLFIAQALVACSENRSYDDVERVLNDFITYYEYAQKNVTPERPEQNGLIKIEQLSSVSADTYRTLAFTWQSQAYLHCVQPDPEPEEESRLSDYDRYVSEEKGSNQVAYIEIGEDDRACFQKYYLSHWTEINEMLNFHYRTFYPSSGR